MSGAVWGAVADAALQVGTAWLNSDAQRNANKTNVKLQREQQQWEERMSNTAIQRRKADIIAAGGNPALAFTNGSEATTPTVTPARVDAPKVDSPRLNPQLMMLRAQTDNLRANTAKQAAEARNTQLDTDIREALADLEVKSRGLEYGNKGVNLDLQQQEIRQRLRQSVESTDYTAAQSDKVRKMTDAMVQEVQQQAETGKINLDALKRIAQIGGAGTDAGNAILKAAISLLQIMIGK